MQANMNDTTYTNVHQLKPLSCSSNNSTGQNRPISIIIKNTTDEVQKFNLFDASNSSELKDGVFTSGGVSIEGLTLNYESFTNNMVSNDQYCIYAMRLQVPAGQETQFQHILTLRKDINRTNHTNFEDEFYPSLNIQPNQEQANIVIIPRGFALTRAVTLLGNINPNTCLLYTSPSPRDLSTSRMPSSA